MRWDTNNRKWQNFWSADNNRQRLTSLGRVLQKTDRILTGDRDLRVIVEELDGIYKNIPAITRGKDLVLNRPFCDISTKAGVVGVIGMNWHELSHYLFTPSNREDGYAAKRAKDAGMWWTYNILEDQRIETLFSAAYKPARMYFAQMVLDQILKDKKVWDQQWPLLHGRRYLPLEIRQNFRERYVNQQNVREMAAIIDEFRVLDLSVKWDRNQDRAFELVKAFHTLLHGDMDKNFQKQQEETAEGCGDATDSSDESGNNKPQPPDNKTSQQASEKAKEETEEQDEKEQDGEDGSQFWEDLEGEDESDEESDETEEGDEEDGEEDSGRGEDSEDSDEQDDSDNGGDGGLSDDGDDADDAEEEWSGDSEGGDSDRDGDSDEGDGADAKGSSQARPNGDDSEVEGDEDEGAKGVGGSGLVDYELKEVLQEALDAIMDSEIVSDEVQRIKDAVNDPSNFDVEASERNIQKRDVPEEAKRQCKLVENEFKKLWAELEPGWHYGADEGRLNVARAMNSDDWDDVFDQWDEGKEQNAGIEVSIAVDVSGSMMYGPNSASPITDAMAAVWTIKRAVEAVDGHVTVISFGEVAKTLISRHDKAKPNEMVFPSDLEGDTRPGEAIDICRYVLNRSEMPNKLFVVVTDGSWQSDPKDHAKTRTALENMPGTKLYMCIGASNPNPQWSGYFHHNSVIAQASDIAPLVRNAINTMLRNAKN